MFAGNAAGEAPACAAKPPSVGGQAVIEGVMMRGPDCWTVTVRRADGALETLKVPYRPWSKRWPVLGKPFIRGAVVLWESLIVGMKALSFSAEIAAQEDEKPAEAAAAAPADKAAGKKAEPAIGFWAMAGAIAAAFGLAILLFVALPHGLSWLAGRLWGFNDTSPLFHLIDGVIKFAFFMAYVWGIGLIPDIKRVYAYHGAEHQAIYTFEASEDLTVANAARHPAWHPRCGTAFIFLVLALSILFFAAIFPLIFNTSGGGFWRGLAGVLIKIVLMLPLAGLAYEVTRLAGKSRPGSIWRVMLWPGLWLQRLTTRPPDASQLEVALEALKQAVPSGQRASEEAVAQAPN